MPEGDTIFRAARTLHRALAGKPVVRFESVFPALTRVHVDTPLTAQTDRQRDRVGQAPADALLGRTGAAHAHAHERQLAHLSSRRTVAAAAPRHADRRGDRRLRRGRLQHPGRGVHRRVEPRAARGAAPARARSAVGDLRRRGGAAAHAGTAGETIADVLLNQRVMAGIGNVYKSEVLFACRHQSVPVSQRSATIEAACLIATARRQSCSPTSTRRWRR